MLAEVLDLVAFVEEAGDVGAHCGRHIDRVVDGVEDAAVGHTDLKVALFGAERAHDRVRHRDDLYIGLDARDSDDICIELPEFAFAPFAYLFVAEEILYGVPACRHRDIARPSGDHAGERRSHFGAKRHLAIRAVAEGVCLFVDDLFGCLRAVEVGRFEYARVVLLVAEEFAHTLHVLVEVALDELIWRIEVADTLIRVGREFRGLLHVSYYTRIVDVGDPHSMNPVRKIVRSVVQSLVYECS